VTAQLAFDFTRGRPVTWACPWCGCDVFGAFSGDYPRVDFTLPLELRVCDTCGDCERRWYPDEWTRSRERRAAREAREHIERLRRILVRFLRDDFGVGPHTDFARPIYSRGRNWPCAEFGKALVGNAFLAALERLGCDRREELARALDICKAGT
jgi:hypothetical protein